MILRSLEWRVAALAHARTALRITSSALGFRATTAGRGEPAVRAGVAGSGSWSWSSLRSAGGEDEATRDVAPTSVMGRRLTDFRTAAVSWSTMSDAWNEPA